MNLKTLSWLVITLGALVALSVEPAAAYIYRTCDGDKVRWSSHQQTFRPMTISFPAGSAERTALARARDGWNTTVPANNFDFLFSYTSATDWEAGDDVNHIASTWDYGWGSDTLGVTLLLFDCDEIVEADILFHPNKSWNFAHHPAPNAGGKHFVLVALHELGHALGLKHEDGWMATMNSYYSNSGVSGNENDPDPHGDDCAGDRALYGSTGSARDLAASIYQEGTDSGESKIIAPPSQAAKGSIQKFRFTLLNRGNENQNTYTVKVYASTDRWITTSDIHLGTAVYGQTAGSDMTVELNIYIPYSLPTGYYYFGFIADPSNTVGEWAEDQNAVGYVNRTYVY